jgi:hypothetical protein
VRKAVQQRDMSEDESRTEGDTQTSRKKRPSHNYYRSRASIEGRREVAWDGGFTRSEVGLKEVGQCRGHPDLLLGLASNVPPGTSLTSSHR